MEGGGANIQLPQEIWNKIAVSLVVPEQIIRRGCNPAVTTSERVDASVYWALVQVSKSMRLPNMKSTLRVVTFDGWCRVIKLPNGQLHAEGEPAYVELSRVARDPTVRSEFWHEDGILHRIGGPACFNFYDQPCYYIRGVKVDFA